MSETFVAIDFETSGQRGCDACSIGLARISDGIVTRTMEQLIRPPSPVVQYTWVHGLTWPMLRGQPGFAEVWPKIAAFIAGAQGLVAHNAPFDRSVLQGCCDAFGCTYPGIPFYCTLKGSRKILGLRKNTLDCVCAHLGIELDHHKAGSDALACAEIFVRLRGLGLSPEAMLSGCGKKPRA